MTRPTVLWYDPPALSSLPGHAAAASARYLKACRSTLVSENGNFVSGNRRLCLPFLETSVDRPLGSHDCTPTIAYGDFAVIGVRVNFFLAKIAGS